MIKTLAELHQTIQAQAIPQNEGRTILLEMTPFDQKEMEIELMADGWIKPESELVFEKTVNSVNFKLKIIL